MYEMITIGPVGFRLSVDDNASLEDMKDMAEHILENSRTLPKDSDGRMVLMIVYGTLTAAIDLREGKEKCEVSNDKMPL